MIIEELGPAISLVEAYPMEATNDNKDPFVTDMTKFTPSAFLTILIIILQNKLKL